jgi:hypothetical protein
MPEQFLDDTDVVTGFQQVRGEGVSKGMAAHWFRDARPLDGLLSVHDRRYQAIDLR